jgi:hypothetical protein
MALSKGEKKRVKRIKAKGEATGKEAKALAKKRSASYTGKAPKGSLGKAVARGGTKADAARLKSLTKAEKKTVKSNVQARRRTTRGKQEKGKKVDEIRRISKLKAEKKATPKASIASALKTLKASQSEAGRGRPSQSEGQRDRLKSQSQSKRAAARLDAYIRGAAGVSSGGGR